MTRSTLRSVGFALASLIFVAACGGDTTQGDASNLEFDQDAAEAFGGSTSAPSTTAPPETTAPPVAGETTTTAAPQTTTTLPPEEQAVSVEITINEGSPQFDPSFVQAQVGSPIRFVNNRAVEVTITELGGQLAPIGPIAPGAVLIYTADTPGNFNFDDGRPFATGQLVVG